jgi:hypothetical protein
MSARALWLEEWAPTCRHRRARAPERGISERPGGRRSYTSHADEGRGDARHAWPSGRTLSDALWDAGPAHASARLRPGRCELVTGQSVWQELEARGATIATVAFSGRAGRGGRIDTILLS